MINLRISTGSNLKGSAPLREVSSVYRAEPLMIAIIFMLETKYNCNNGHERDLIWLQSSSQRGPNTIANSVPNPTIYDCNLFQKGPNMIAVIENLFSRDSSRNHSHVTVGKFLILQSYLVLFEKDYGTIRNWHCN